MIPAAHSAGLKVLASVTTAPAHTRRAYQGILHPTHGRPEDIAQFGLFIARLIQRYPKMIQAIEMWNEPNLMREWGDALSGSAYGQLLAVGYGVSKYMDPEVLVISAGIAPTGFNADWEALDDTPFLQRLLEHNGAAYFDCLGAHANGPDGIGDIDRVAQRYFELTGKTKFICATEMGYGIPVNGHAPKGFDWVMSHTVEGQVHALTDGMKWAQQSGFVRLVILWNLNYAGPSDDPNAPYALVREGWESPALEAIRQFIQSH